MVVGPGDEVVPLRVLLPLGLRVLVVVLVLFGCSDRGSGVGRVLTPVPYTNTYPVPDVEVVSRVVLLCGRGSDVSRVPESKG